jgi:hypothetical protein
VLHSLDLRDERFRLVEAEGAQQQVVSSAQPGQLGVELYEPASFRGNLVGTHDDRTIV